MGQILSIVFLSYTMFMAGFERMDRAREQGDLVFYTVIMWVPALITWLKVLL